ncbi:acetylxylan esterase [Ktedonospora formicarum]|uniref:Acetylxylan esterase n=1 Tax=Ktedonospora formicarum TaxID=2778364 RepID=A0A8J3MUI2_9CHLR|nr:acetylxylan esterase [Ktedonospora formicarum]GHO46648.1 acetylxylan esterase [Ktedonospora formicarum]
MLIDMPLQELEQYRPALTAQEDFDAFWQQTLAVSNAQPLDASFELLPTEEYAYVADRVNIYNVHFNGFGEGTRVAGWYLVPKADYRREKDGKIPTIVQYHGYSGGRGLPSAYLHWALQGYAILAVDTRGQDGDTPDNHQYVEGGFVGFMTKGLLQPEHYYYRHVYMDCVRAIDVVRSRPETGPIFITGGSQGGGLTLAVAALAQDKGIVAAMPDVPFLCHFRRSIEIYSAGPYQELVDFWKRRPHTVEESYRTLSYFDGLNFAPRISCPVLLSVALMDTICPPSSGFAVYNHLGGEKSLRVYPFNGHEGGSNIQEQEKYRFVHKLLQG